MGVMDCASLDQEAQHGHNLGGTDRDSLAGTLAQAMAQPACMSIEQNHCKKQACWCSTRS